MTFQPTRPIQPETPRNQATPLKWMQQAKATLKAGRVPLFIAAALLFVFGLAYSISRLDLALSDIALFYVALSALVFVPVAFFYGAVNFMVMARGAGVDVGFASAFKVSCVAQFAEFLPIPGGAIVRGGALMQRGSGAVEAASHVTVNALLWVACAAIAGGLSIGFNQSIGLVITLGGAVAALACTLWLASKAGIGIALGALMLRIVGLFIAGARLFAAFLAIGIAVEWLDLYPYVFATILGSAASIAPGGLGISEAVAAALALLSTLPPEAAFLAVGLNRAIGLAMSGLATGIITLFFSDNRTHST